VFTCELLCSDVAGLFELCLQYVMLLRSRALGKYNVQLNRCPGKKKDTAEHSWFALSYAQLKLLYKTT
jgi:hypothetical protein